MKMTMILCLNNNTHLIRNKLQISSFNIYFIIYYSFSFFNNSPTKQVTFSPVFVSLLSPQHNKNETSELLSTKMSMKTSITKRLSIYDIETVNKNNAYRKDAYGNVISKGKKNFKISFIDNVSPKKLAEIILIDSFKSTNKRGSSDGVCGCHCLVM